MTLSYGADANTLGLEFNGNVNAANWQAVWIEVFDSGGWQTADDVENDGAVALIASAAAFPEDLSGKLWRIVNAPAGVLTPQNGTVPP